MDAALAPLSHPLPILPFVGTASTPNGGSPPPMAAIPSRRALRALGLTLALLLPAVLLAVHIALKETTP